MTTNKQIEETMEFNKKIIPILLSGFRYEDKYDEHFVAGQLKEEFDKLIKQTQKDTLDKVLEIIGEDIDTSGHEYNSSELLRVIGKNELKYDLRLKLNQLEKELI